MTKRFPLNLQIALTIACIMMIAGCDAPIQKSEQIDPPSLQVSAGTDVSAGKGENAASLAVPTPITEKKDTAPKKPEYPYFKTYKVEEKIVIEGALKSKLQIEDIVSALERSFPNLKIENKLVREPHRHAVGWGNRVGSSLLVDYFEMVKAPGIEFKEGIVTLKGGVSNEGVHKTVTEMAITVFSDTWTDDLVNEIKVGN